MRKRFQSLWGNSFDVPEVKTRTLSSSALDTSNLADSSTRTDSPKLKSYKRQDSNTSIHSSLRLRHKPSCELFVIDSDLDEEIEDSSSDSVFFDSSDVSRTMLAPILPPEASPLKSPRSPPVSTLPRFMRNGKLKKSTSFKGTLKEYENVNYRLSWQIVPGENQPKIFKSTSYKCV